MTHHDPAAVSVRHVTRTFTTGRRPVTAVDDVSFEVALGESLGIIGESGSGKSTLSRIIMGLEHPDVGEVELFGHPVLYQERLPRAKRLERAARIQMVFQDPILALDPRQTPAESLDEILRVHGRGNPKERASRCAEVFERVGLGDREANTVPRFLSGGQRQRVAIARALCLAPSILVLDEAVAALDVSIQAQILDLLAEIRDSLSLSYLFITHDLAVVQATTDRLIVMRRGRIVEAGATREVLRNPTHPYTRLLLESVPSRNWDLERVRRLRTELDRFEDLRER